MGGGPWICLKSTAWLHSGRGAQCTHGAANLCPSPHRAGACNLPLAFSQESSQDLTVSSSATCLTAAEYAFTAGEPRLWSAKC